MSSSPHIVAEIHLPTTLSFTSESEPELKLTLTLVGSQNPVIISKENYNVFTPTNAFTITEVPSGQAINTVFVDICKRVGPPPRLDSEHLDKFLTLDPDIPYEVFKISFRPLGQERISTQRTAAPTDPSDTYQKYKFLSPGMHWLEPGKQYLIRACQNARITPWRWGRIEELMPCDWYASDGEALEILSAEGVEVEVVE
ncbi:uncharacterized protein GGS22DRAFT_175499 [Annulohypoxylon maeteangense]|uniref:uncharacterized protein n=1 Tax=Annulohypoxylon maeteangense TaxID=1927788 RepID=UPI0020086DD9|nr:uncharacterized protein GGS22DRAFT_175499 [Annulohypoxylon maeteangense]KAI0880239.1 hypothetical protein GGS22DRAFT_175499 [Annulohypoxylon maeteangense]